MNAGIIDGIVGVVGVGAVGLPFSQPTMNNSASSVMFLIVDFAQGERGRCAGCTRSARAGCSLRPAALSLQAVAVEEHAFQCDPPCVRFAFRVGSPQPVTAACQFLTIGRRPCNAKGRRRGIARPAARQPRTARRCVSTAADAPCASRIAPEDFTNLFTSGTLSVKWLLRPERP